MQTNEETDEMKQHFNKNHQHNTNTNTNTNSNALAITVSIKKPNINNKGRLEHT